MVNKTELFKVNGKEFINGEKITEMCGLIFEGMKVKASNLNKSTVVNLKKDLDSTETYHIEYNRLDINVARVIKDKVYIVEFRCDENYIEVLMCDTDCEEHIKQLEQDGKW